MQWFETNPATPVVLLLVMLMVGASIGIMIRNGKKGKHILCDGCGDCSSCEHCAHCSDNRKQ